MKRFILVITIFLLAGGITDAMAGSYVITTTAGQDAILNRIATAYGATPEQVIKQSAISHLTGAVRTLNMEQRRRLMDKLDEGTLDAQAASDLQVIIDAHGN